MQLMVDDKRKEYVYNKDKEVISIIFIHEQDYAYESEQEQEFHYEQMLNKGFKKKWNVNNFYNYVKFRVEEV